MRPGPSILVVAALVVVVAGGIGFSEKSPNVSAEETPTHRARPADSDTSWYPWEIRPPFRGDLLEEDVEDVIYAGSATFVVGEPPAIPAELEKPLARGGVFQPGWFIVHFEGAVSAEDKQFLDRLTGAVVREDGSALARWYLPNNSLLAHVRDQATLAELQASLRIDWIGRYQPAYKLDASIGTVPLSSPGRVGRATMLLDVDLIPGAPVSQVIGGLEALGGDVLDEIHLRGERTHDVHFLVVAAAPVSVARLAEVEGVRMIQEHADGVQLYDLSGGGKLQNRTLNVDDQANSPIVTAARFPLWLTHNLQGQHQLVGVVDTALDWNNVGTTGCGFGFPDTAIQNYGFADPNLARVLLGSVGSGGVTLKVPRADLLGGAALLGTAGNEHGCAVSGAALADFYGNNDQKWWEHDVDTWESWAPSNFSGLLGPGIAHEAQLYFTPVMGTGNVFRWESFGEFETNMNITLDNMAAAGVCSTIHSVGLAEANNTYTQVSVTHDTNAFDHQDMLQCIAAGNSGAVANALSSQAVVKNALTVGASDDVLKPEDRASFSSIGPRFDGARKPDIMTPGTDTFPRAGGTQSLLILPDTNGSSSASCSYQWTSGTSFSAPIAGGATALVHQYFEEGRYPGDTPITNPSAALMKAMLVNAGHRLTGANLGNGQYPNDYQGWGEPNLSQVFDFGLGSRRLIAYDVPSSGGFTAASNPNDVRSFTVNGSADVLKVSLVWTDEPGSTGTGKKLINDLDLIVTAPGGTTYRGNVFNGTSGTSITGGAADTLNNVENVILSGPATGTWTAAIDPGAGNYSVGQGFALVITGNVIEGGGGGPGAPVANFSGSPLSGTAPLAVNFTDLSTGTVDTWAWTFGDGGTSSLENPSHVYASPGTYDVTLTASGPGGSDAETKLAYVTVSSPPSGNLWYLSFTSTTAIPGLGNMDSADVVSYDSGSNTWALYFDGSDVGVTTNVDALHVLSDGDLVLSFDAALTVPGLVGGPSGTSVDDSDLVIFDFITSGASTTGTFSFIFDGSDVGLTTSDEDIDGVYEFPAGGLGISTVGNVSVTGVSGVDEDVLFFSPTLYGATTTGTYTMYFDGSDVGFGDSSNDDLDAVDFDAGIDLLFSTVGTYSGAGGTGSDEDVSRFSGTFGSTTSGSAQLELDLSAIGISTGEDVDGLALRP